ncbi:hypothetical protein Tco_0542799 [Tanacetum coccineum]
MEDLTLEEKLRKSCDIKDTNILLLGLPVDICTLIKHHKTANEIWDRVKELMEGMELTLQERESKLYDDFDRFTSEKGESIHSYYLRYAKFVTAAKQAKDLHIVNFDQLYAFLKHNENEAKEVREMRQRYPNLLALLPNTYNPHPSYSSQRSQYNPPAEYNPHQPYQTYQSYQRIIPSSQQQIIHSAPQKSYEPPVVSQQPSPPPTQLDLGFVVPSFLPTNDPIASLKKAMMFPSIAISSRFPPINNQLRTSSNPRTQAIIQDGRVTLLTRSNFKEDHIDAFDLDCDDEATTSEIFMESLSPAASINGDTIGPTYDSDILYEVPHYDNYHETDVLNSIA